MAAMSWNCAGNSARCVARAMVMVPVSSGSRSASSAMRLNSGNSSRNKTPWCASDISPGRGGFPPPTNATALAEWCGLQVGRMPHCAMSKRPAKERTAALSRAWSSSIGGSKPAKRCANMDLPEPGGPLISTECPPAAAISSARLAADCPFTSAKSATTAAALRAMGNTRTQPSLFASPVRSSLGKGVGTKRRTTSSKWRARMTGTSGTKAASSALPGGSTSCLRLPHWRRASAVARAPRTGRSSPESDNSPANS